MRDTKWQPLSTCYVGSALQPPAKAARKVQSVTRHGCHLPSGIIVIKMSLALLPSGDMFVHQVRIPPHRAGTLEDAKYSVLTMVALSVC